MVSLIQTKGRGVLLGVFARAFLRISVDFFKETLIVSGKREGQEGENEHRCEDVKV